MEPTPVANGARRRTASVSEHTCPPVLAVDDAAARREKEQKKKDFGSNGQESEWANGNSCAQPP